MSGMATWKAKIELDIKDLQKQLIDADEKIDKFTNEDRKVKLDIDTKTLESAIQKLNKMLDSLSKGTGDFKQFENLSKELSSIVSEVQSLSKAFGKVDDSGAKTLLSSIQNIDKSLSELSQNILNVNKNMSNMGGNTSGAVKQVETISNAYQDAAKKAEKLADAQSKIGQKTNISLTSDSTVEQQIKSESELNAEIEKRENIIRELQQLQEKLTVHEDFHGNDRYFADQLPTEEEIREADKRIKQLTGTNNIFNVDKLIQDRNKWLSEVKYSLEEYDDLIKANDQKALDEYTTRGLSRIGGAESFFGYEDNNFSIASKFDEEKEKIQNEINDLYTDLDKLDEKMNLDSNNSSVDNTVQSQEKLQSELKETQKQAEKTAQAVKESTTTASTGQKKDAFPKTSENLEQVAQSEQKVQQEAKAIQSKWEQAEKAIQNYMNAVTKLNNLRASDKSTGKKSYEIAGQIEEIEKLKKEAYDARQVLSSMINPQNVDIDTWKRYVDVINRLDQASNGSAESVNRLKDSLKNTLNSELNSLQNSIDKYQNIITQAQTYPSDFHPSTEYNTKLAKLESANEVLKNYKVSLQGVTELTKEQQNQINRLTQNCEKAATEFKNLSAAEKGTIKVGVEKAIQRINKDLAENTKYSAEAKAGLNALLEQLKSGDPSINLRKITEEIIKIENAEIAAGRAGKSLWDIFKTKSTYGFIGQMQSYLSMYVGFYGMVNGVKKAVSTITELDTALVDLKKTTAMNENQLENFYYDSNNVAKQMGVTTKEIIDQASAWSRLGYSTAETATTMAKLSSQFASISPGMSTDEAQEGLVSIMKAFDIDPNDVETEIMDKVNVLGNKFAENNQDVVEGLKRSAAAMSAMGQSFTDTAALFTGGMEILQDSESMGTALRTLSMRIRGYDEETNQLSDDLVNVTGEVADLTKTAQDSQGVSLFTDATQEHYRSMVEYLGDIADRWEQISEKNQTEFCLYVQKCA